MKNHRISISDIRIGKRFRADLGDIVGLAESIEAVGLLEPIVLRAGNWLVAGIRRLEAAKLLGWPAIDAVVVSGLEEALAQLRAEADENTHHKAFTLVEAVAAGEALRPLVEQQVDAEHAAKSSAGGKKAGKYRPAIRGGESFPTPDRDEAKRTRARIAAAVGLSDRTYEKAAAVIESRDAELIDELKRTNRANGAAKKLKVKKQAAAIAAEPPPLPAGPFRVIVADPPWRYAARESDASHRSSNPFPSMTVEEIQAMPIRDLGCKDSVLWLWTTNAFLRPAFDVAEAWGYEPKTILTWVKSRMGTGDWLRGKTEHCLFCARGKPIIQLSNQTTVLIANSGEHSRKPEEFYSLVDGLCPGSKLELFRRKKKAEKPREGWIYHGDEA